jgi:uridine kinase
MKIIAISSVSAGGKTTIVNELKKKLPNATSLHFDEYSFEGEIDDFRKWVLDGADYNVWNLSPLKSDIISIKKNGQYDYLLLDYPFAYLHNEIKEYIDCAIFIDTPLDIAMARRVLRDMKHSTGEEIRNDMEAYLNYARIAYVQMLKDIRPSSDYVIDGTESTEILVDKIMNIIL